MRQQLELATELESGLQNLVDWGKKWLVDFSAGKTQLVLFDWSSDSVAFDVKMDGSVLEVRCWECWHCLSLLNWVGALTLSPLLRLLPRKLESWFLPWSFYFPKLLFTSTNLRSCIEYCCHVWAGALNPLSANPTKWSNTLKQFVGKSRRIECAWPFYEDGA